MTLQFGALAASGRMPFALWGSVAASGRMPAALWAEVWAPATHVSASRNLAAILQCVFCAVAKLSLHPHS